MKVKNEKTGETRTATSNAEGFFIVPSLKPSTYTITITKAGFAPIEYTEMPVAVGQELTLDFELKVTGGVEALTVTAAAPVLDLSSAKIGASVSEREVQNLPVNGRQMSSHAAGARLAERRQGPGATSAFGARRRAERDQRRRRGVGDYRFRARRRQRRKRSLFKLQASLENVQEFRVESVAIRQSSAPAPADR